MATTQSNIGDVENNYSIMSFSKEILEDVRMRMNMHNICLLGILSNIREDPIPMRNSVTRGRHIYYELMATNNVQRFVDNVRMKKETFIQLLDLLKRNGLKETRQIKAGEKLMIYIYVLCGNSNRNTGERWQHSGNTISMIIRHVLSSISKVQYDYIKQTSHLSGKIHNDGRFFPFF